MRASFIWFVNWFKDVCHHFEEWVQLIVAVSVVCVSTQLSYDLWLWLRGGVKFVADCVNRKKETDIIAQNLDAIPMCTEHIICSFSNNVFGYILTV